MVMQKKCPGHAAAQGSPGLQGQSPVVSPPHWERGTEAMEAAGGGGTQQGAGSVEDPSSSYTAERLIPTAPTMTPDPACPSYAVGAAVSTSGPR